MREQRGRVALSVAAPLLDKLYLEKPQATVKTKQNWPEPVENII